MAYPNLNLTPIIRNLSKWHFFFLSFEEVENINYNRKEVKNMDKEQHQKVVDALVDFVIRVANGKTTTEKEVEVLPAVVSVLFINHFYS